jgi:Beta-propeller repeat
MSCGWLVWSRAGRRPAALITIVLVTGCGASGGSTVQPVAPTRATEHALSSYARLPLAFAPNVGQSDRPVRFVASGPTSTLFLTSRGAVLSLAARRGSSRPTLWLHFVDASHPVLHGGDRLPGKVNYLIGNDRSRWRTDVPTYGKVRYAGLWRGVDASFYGGRSGIEYDLRLAPGADPRQIAVRFGGAERQRLDPSGALVLTLPDGQQVREVAPFAYQVGADGRRRAVASRFVLASGIVRIALDRYDRRRALIVDPALVYSTYLGGGGFEQGSGVAVDSTGDAYVAGATASTDFPTVSPVQSGNGGGGSDAFVAKLNPTGSALIYATYLGGSGFDGSAGIAIDSSGDAYVSGSTRSTDFPTKNAEQPACGDSGCPAGDTFVSKLNPTGNGLVYSTYVGGSSGDEPDGIAVDSGGSAYVSGTTTSTNFPTHKAEQPTCGDSGCTGGDAFLTKFSPTGSTLDYSTYLGGNSAEIASGIGIDAAGEAYVSGYTISSNFPTMNALQPTSPGLIDGFVSKFNAAGSALVYSTYLGGSGADAIRGIAVDAAGDAYVTGVTLSTDFPLRTPSQSSCGDPGCGKGDAFAAKINMSGNGLDYSTYLGGNGQDIGFAVTEDAVGNAYVVGYTTSTDFRTVNAAQAACGDPGCSQGDAFVTEINSSGNGQVYSSYLGGGDKEQAYGVAVDGAGATYVTGFTSSTSDFPVVNPLQPTYGGGVSDAFIAKFAGPDLNAPTSSAVAPICRGPVTASVTDNPGGSGPAVVLHRLDGGPTQASATSGNPGTAAIAIPEGNHTLEYWGEDAAGNQEAPSHFLSTQIDTTPPSLSIVGDQGFSSYEVGDHATVTISASDATSGLAADPSRSHVEVSTANAGHYTASTSTTDRCGNSTSTSFTYRVIPNPALYRNVNVETQSGTVKLGRARLLPLIGARQVPVGTDFDATAGSVRLTTATNRPAARQRGIFTGDRFELLQPRADHGVAVLSLQGAGKCTRSSTATDRPKTLHAVAKGHFRTSGRYASATTVGPSAAWSIADNCAGTTIRVGRGRVVVQNLRSHNNEVLREGQHYVAPAK